MDSEGGGTTPIIMTLYCRVQYGTETEWIKITSPCSYDEIILVVKRTFPTLEGEFILQDDCGANLRGDFLEEYIKISPRGVLLKFVSVRMLSSFTSSCLTITNYEYSSDASSSYSNYDNAVQLHLPQKNISKEELYEIIHNSPGGREIEQFYNTYNTLSDEQRKKLVNICANYLHTLFPETCMPSAFSREQCAKAIVAIFPRLRDPDTKEGHVGQYFLDIRHLDFQFYYFQEAFYDPHTKKGFLTTRLRTLIRKRKAEFPLSSTSKKIFLNEQPKNLVSTEQEVEEIEAAIVFMRHANNNEIDEIKEKLKFTFQYRRKNGCTIEKYPRLIDTKGMISYEFSLIQPDKENLLLDKFPLYLENIFKVYHLTLKNPTLDVSSDNKSDWNRTTRAFLSLLYLLPPTAKGKNSGKESAYSAQDFVLLFQKKKCVAQTKKRLFVKAANVSNRQRTDPQQETRPRQEADTRQEAEPQQGSAPQQEDEPQ
ncbi:hypothetical protein FQR65_LT03473 [Abscondita terminalis]|nr:hypothetical protein FQR65_LT03473 [Abscondita terminalis]